MTRRLDQSPVIRYNGWMCPSASQHDESETSAPVRTDLIDQGINLPAVPVAQSPVEKFREFLEIRNLKCTGERLRIVEHVFEKHNHFEADQLVASMEEKHLRVSRSTVYRTLRLLVEAGMLRDLQFGPRTAYEHDYGYPAHEHLYCERCGRVIEFISEDLQTLQEDICREHHFRPTIQKFIIQGVCEQCNRSSSHRRRLDMI
jgi:Fur family ferric uptake transcriptional regulator